MVDGANAVKEVAVKTGWLDAIKENLSVDAISKRFDLSKEKMIALVVYLGAGLLFGFLLKRFFKYVLFLGAILIAVYFLQKAGAINIAIDWDKMNEFFGIKSISQVDGNFFWGYWLWIKANVAISISFLIGFIIGWKIS